MEPLSSSTGATWQLRTPSEFHAVQHDENVVRQRLFGTPYGYWNFGDIAESEVGTPIGCAAFFSIKTNSKQERSTAMTYRVYSGPAGSGPLSAFDKDRMLYKEFETLDGALGWARHVNSSGRVTLAIEGDDGTQLDMRDVTAALRHPEEAGLTASVSRTRPS
jgi:hypothetical protein